MTIWPLPAVAVCILAIGLCDAAAQEVDNARAGSGSLECTAPAEFKRFKGNLPNTARAIRNGQELTIVAIGSSSTEGIGASDSSRAYPAQLAAALKRLWPSLDVRVINKGVGGEDAAQMIERFEHDVLPYDPQLVIWQVGSNYALRSRDLEAYAEILRRGINRLKSMRTDVMLMDLQYAPRVLEKPIHRRLLDTMRALANDLKVGVFRRYAIMRNWVSSGQYRMEEIVTRDRLHMNDASYSCIAKLIAQSVSVAAKMGSKTADERNAAAPHGF